jgi:hypothetical protein
MSGLFQMDGTLTYAAVDKKGHKIAASQGRVEVQSQDMKLSQSNPSPATLMFPHFESLSPLNTFSILLRKKNMGTNNLAVDIGLFGHKFFHSEIDI